MLFSLRWFVLKFILFQAGSRNIDLELTTLSSANHVELSPSDAGFQDRYVVQEVIKEMAKNRPIDTKGKRGFKGNFFWMICYAIIYEWTSFPDDDDDNNYCYIFYRVGGIPIENIITKRCLRIDLLTSSEYKTYLYSFWVFHYWTFILSISWILVWLMMVNMFTCPYSFLIFIFFFFCIN